MKFKSMYRDLEIEVENCPLCGREPKVLNYGNKYTPKIKVEIKCKSCNLKLVQGAIAFDMDWLEDTTIKNWNNRSVSNETY